MIEIPSLARIRAALESAGGGPRRSFGQHFLTDPALLGRIVDAAEIRSGEVVLEVGPGPGVLTATLLHRAARVVAVEADPAMVALLRSLLGAPDGLDLVEIDALAERPAPGPTISSRIGVALGGSGAVAGRYAFVANLPYQIATPLLLDVFENEPPRIAVVMIQREVADRLRARPGDADYGVATVLLALFATVDEVFRLKPGAFWPSPKVDSSCVRIEPRRDPMVARADAARVRAIVRAAFGQRRKTLVNALVHATDLGRDRVAGALAELGHRPEVRAERLAPEEFVALEAALRGP